MRPDSSPPGAAAPPEAAQHQQDQEQGSGSSLIKVHVTTSLGSRHTQGARAPRNVGQVRCAL